jgi:hypothetical protein
MDRQLDAEERARTVAEFRAQGDQRLPADRKPAGCALLIATPPLLIFAPQLVSGRGTAIVVVAAALVVVGIYLVIFGGSAQWRALERRAFSGLDPLATRFASMLADERRSAAVRALYHAHYAGGPGSFPVYDANAQSERLGEALPYLQSVERVLIAEGLMHPTFTEPEQPAGQGP